MENCESASRFFLWWETKAWSLLGEARAMVASLEVHVDGARGPWTLLAVSIGFVVFAPIDGC